MKQKMNKLMHYMWYYFWNIGVNYFVLLPIYAVILLVTRLYEAIKYTLLEAKCAIDEQRIINSKDLDVLKEELKDKA